MLFETGVSGDSEEIRDVKMMRTKDRRRQIGRLLFLYFWESNFVKDWFQVRGRRLCKEFGTFLFDNDIRNR